MDILSLRTPGGNKGGTDRVNLCTLAKLREIPLEGVEEAARRGLLTFETHRHALCWKYGDSENACLRRLDGKPFIIGREPVKAESTTRGDKWHKLIGLDDVVKRHARDVLLVEGTPDALAAFAFAVAEGREADIGVCVALGEGTRILPADATVFVGRRVRIFPDATSSGVEAAELWAATLAEHADSVQIFDLSDLRWKDGKPAKDLNDAIRIAQPDARAEFGLSHVTDLDRRGPRVRIVEQSPRLGLNGPEDAKSGTKENQDYQDYPRVPKTTQERERGGATGNLEDLMAYAQKMRCHERATSRKRLFELGRRLAGYERIHGAAHDLRLQVFGIWYDASRQFLDTKKPRYSHFASFLRGLSKVRKPHGEEGSNAIVLAMERAKHKPLPEIPDVPDAEESFRFLAAVGRELQIIVGPTASYVLTARTAMQIIGSKRPMDGLDAIRDMETLGVHECTKRGESKPGGKGSEFRYLLTLIP